MNSPMHNGADWLRSSHRRSPESGGPRIRIDASSTVSSGSWQRELPGATYPYSMARGTPSPAASIAGGEPASGQASWRHCGALRIAKDGWIGRCNLSTARSCAPTNTPLGPEVVRQVKPWPSSWRVRHEAPRASSLARQAARAAGDGWRATRPNDVRAATGGGPDPAGRARAMLVLPELEAPFRKMMGLCSIMSPISPSASASASLLLPPPLPLASRSSPTFTSRHPLVQILSSIASPALPRLAQRDTSADCLFAVRHR